MQTLAAEESQVRFEGIQELAHVYLRRLPYFNRNFNRTALRHLDNVADAEDAVQNAFVSSVQTAESVKR